MWGSPPLRNIRPHACVLPPVELLVNVPMAVGHHGHQLSFGPSLRVLQDARQGKATGVYFRDGSSCGISRAVPTRPIWFYDDIMPLASAGVCSWSSTCSYGHTSSAYEHTSA